MVHVFTIDCNKKSRSFLTEIQKNKIEKEARKLERERKKEREVLGKAEKEKREELAKKKREKKAREKEAGTRET